LVFDNFHLTSLQVIETNDFWWFGLSHCGIKPSQWLPRRYNPEKDFVKEPPGWPVGFLDIRQENQHVTAFP
jgi:hypothetical protein